MDNETKLSSEQINSIMNEAKNQGAKGSINTDKFIKEHLTSQQAEKVKEVLSDPEKLRAILNSPFAKKFMESMKGKQNGE